jgi:hypothetical protein
VNESQGPLAPGELEEVVSSKHPGVNKRSKVITPT